MSSSTEKQAETEESSASNSCVSADHHATIDSAALIKLVSDVATALNTAMPAWNEPKMAAAKFRFWIAGIVIFALWSLIITALVTNHDQIVRDLVIALASFLGGFAASRTKTTD
ncbi:MAG: hypothetical protein R8K20_11670 [Gallionellaceae bacterium]